MPRPPLEIGTWGNIPTPIEVAPGVFRAMTRYRDTDGVTRKVEARAASRNKARQALETRLRARRAPASREVTPDTRLRDVVKLWEAELVERGRAANTLKRYRMTIENHILKGAGGVGDLRLRECSTWRMNEFLQGIRRDHGAASAKVAKTVLAGILSLAARYEAIPTNPLREVAPIPTSRPEVRALSPADVRILRRRLGEWQSTPPANGRQRRPDDLRDVVDVMLAT
ncbi:site-specific integrase, partial [Thiopseudomonas sp. 4R-3cl]